MFIYNIKSLSSTTVWLKNIFAFALYLNSAPSAPSLWNIRYYSAAGVRQHSVVSGSISISYFQLFGKNRHVSPSLTNEYDSLSSWLARSTLYFACKCLFFRQSMLKVTNVTNLPPDDNASGLVSIWWIFWYDIPLILQGHTILNILKVIELFLILCNYCVFCVS